MRALSQALLKACRGVPLKANRPTPTAALLGTRGLAAATPAASPEVYDVVIVGGGMVGAALAACLKAEPLTSMLRVALVDKQTPPEVENTALAGTPPDLRVSTLTPATINLLKRAYAWEAVEPRSAPFSRMQVWDDAGEGCIVWEAADAGVERMGYVAENALIQSACLAALRPLTDPVDTLWGAGVDSLALPPSSPASDDSGPLAAVSLGCGAELRARLVVGADGAGSRTRAAAGLRAVGWAYGQKGLVATVSTSGGGGATAHQRFLRTGPLALLPVRDGLHNIVWSTTPAHAAALEKMSGDEFAAAVNAALHDPPSSLTRNPLVDGVLGRIRGEGHEFQAPPYVTGFAGPTPRSFPLRLSHTGKYVRPRLALVGDAAHAVHPLAGQGVNLGFGDVEALTEALAYGVRHGIDVGSRQLLEERYEVPRQRANIAMMAALDGLKRTFDVSAAPLSGLRNLGLDVINSVGPVRTQIMRYAMGL